MAKLKIYALEKKDWFNSHDWVEDKSKPIYDVILPNGQHKSMPQNLICESCGCTVKVLGTWPEQGKELMYFIDASDGDLSCSEVIEKKNTISEAPVENAKIEKKKVKLIDEFNFPMGDAIAYDPDDEDYPTGYGTSTHFLTKEHLEDLQQGKIIGIDDGEYIHYLKLK